MSTRVIGIDLGTTNSVVSYTDEAGNTHVLTDENGDRIIPSVIQFGRDGEIVVGKRAKDAAAVYPDRVASLFKRGMGEGGHLEDGKTFELDGTEYPPEVLSSIVLKKLAGMAESYFGEPVKDAVITVPYYFGDQERAATRTAGELAGLNVLRIINEPTAAAIARGVDLDAPDIGKLLVFDLGGGTFDVTVIKSSADGELEVISGDGDHTLGGADFDTAIFDDMVDTIRSTLGPTFEPAPDEVQDLRAQAEEVKKELSTASSALRRLVAGGQSHNYELSREQFEGLISEEVTLVREAVQRALLVEAVQETVDRVMMVGGSSRIPFFQSLVNEITGHEPELSKNLDEDVSRGAAMLGAKLGVDTLDPRSQLAQMPSPTDASSHGLGISLVRDGSVDEEYNQVIIPPHTAIPHAGNHDLFTVENGQTHVTVTVNEGDDEDLDFIRELGRSTGALGRPVPAGHPLRLEVQWTEEALVRLNLYDATNNNHLTELTVDRKNEMSAEDKSAARDFLMNTEIN